MGNLLGIILTISQISAEVDRVVGGADSYSVSVLMGKRDEMMLDLVARRIAADMARSGCRKRLLLSTCLKSHDLALVDLVVQPVIANKAW